MKAYRQYRYGSPDVLHLEDIDLPDPGEGQLQVRVQAVSVNPLDWHLMRATPFFVRFSTGLFAPKKKGIGADFSGVVEKVGPGVTEYAVGDEVFGEGREAFAELVNVSVKHLAKKPGNMSFSQAAAIPVAGLTALQGLRDHGRLAAGQSVLINGASGGVGTFAVQIAKAYGAGVTGVCSHRNLELVSSLGADRVLDYTKEDFLDSGQQYDLVMDVAGSRKVAESLRAVKPGGRLILIGMTRFGLLISNLIRGPKLARKAGKHFANFTAVAQSKDLKTLAELCESGKLIPAIDRSFPFDQLPNAIKYIETMRASAKVVVTVGDQGESEKTVN
jgi:NADPH:quinone reductase-like Zn-dependent oxidoreductase